MRYGPNGTTWLPGRRLALRRWLDQTRLPPAISSGAAGGTITFDFESNLIPTSEGTPLMPRGSDGSAQALQTVGTSSRPEIPLVESELPPFTGVTGAELTDDGFEDVGLTDAELTALALAADPNQPIDAGARPLDLYSGRSTNFLPLWYMPPVMMRRSPGWRTGVIVAVVSAFLLINALGLCITYGQLGAA